MGFSWSESCKFECILNCAAIIQINFFGPFHLLFTLSCAIYLSASKYTAQDNVKNIWKGPKKAKITNTKFIFALSIKRYKIISHFSNKFRIILISQRSSGSESWHIDTFLRADLHLNLVQLSLQLDLNRFTGKLIAPQMRVNCVLECQPTNFSAKFPRKSEIQLTQIFSFIKSLVVTICLTHDFFSRATFCQSTL